MSNDFAAYLAALREKLNSVASVSEEKDIAYGHQFKIVHGSEKAVLTAYDGKKGRRLVWGGAESALRSELQAVVEGKPVSFLAQDVSVWQGMWAGSDESGKGDFFGPLVVAAVIVDETTAEKLQKAGVKDCKLLSDKKILQLEDVIKENVVDSAVLELKPHIYNMRYEQVKAEGDNLNQLLGYGHVAALSQVLAKHGECKGALIDQFTKSNAVLKSLQAKFPTMTFRQQPKAESDLAVAAASVLARAKFLRSMDELALLSGEEELPKGGGELATECAKRIAERLGKEELRKFVKLHFANYQRI